MLWWQCCRVIVWLAWLVIQSGIHFFISSLNKKKKTFSFLIKLFRFELFCWFLKRPKTIKFKITKYPLCCPSSKNVVAINCSTGTEWRKWQCWKSNSQHFVLIGLGCVHGTAATAISVQTRPTVSGSDSVSCWYQLAVESRNGRARCQSAGQSRFAETCYVLG